MCVCACVSHSHARTLPRVSSASAGGCTCPHLHGNPGSPLQWRARWRGYLNAGSPQAIGPRRGGRREVICAVYNRPALTLATSPSPSSKSGGSGSLAPRADEEEPSWVPYGCAAGHGQAVPTGDPGCSRRRLITPQSSDNCCIAIQPACPDVHSNLLIHPHWL